ncbi:hypothetical protein MMC12_003040 [Toensbergia leucococca]|nr:hypothetical protein [Toensbergia leucococca]
MSSSTFRPHGLIKSLVQERLYHEAHITNITSGTANPKEEKTKALKQAMLSANYFPESEYFVVSSEQSPTPTSQRSCDLVIRYIDIGGVEIRTLCFGECKRASTSQPFSLRALEKQGQEYSRLYLDYEKDVQFIYVATMAGAHIRLWTCHRHNPELVPFWGDPQEKGEWRRYKDIGDDTEREELERWFGYMKAFPPTRRTGQDSHSFGTPSMSANPGTNYCNASHTT